MAMIAAIKNFPENSQPIVRNLSLMPSFYEGKAYVFLQLKVEDIADYDVDYRPKRQAMLEIACGAAKNKFPNLHTIVGIAIDAPKFAKKNAEDFVLMNCMDWTDEDREHYERANEGFNFFNTPNLISRRNNEKEFPSAASERRSLRRRAKVGRNDACPCGSGRKYKKCCL
jgi:SEC-C motif